MKKIWLAVVMMVGLSGCASLQPWERGNLGLEEMNFKDMSSKSLTENNYRLVEGLDGYLITGGAQ